MARSRARSGTTGCTEADAEDMELLPPTGSETFDIVFLDIPRRDSSARPTPRLERPAWKAPALE